MSVTLLSLSNFQNRLVIYAHFYTDCLLNTDVFSLWSTWLCFLYSLLLWLLFLLTKERDWTNPLGKKQNVLLFPPEWRSEVVEAGNTPYTKQTEVGQSYKADVLTWVINYLHACGLIATWRRMFARKFVRFAYEWIFCFANSSWIWFIRRIYWEGYVFYSYVFCSLCASGYKILIVGFHLSVTECICKW